MLLMSEAFMKRTGISEELNSDGSVVDNTFLKGGVMLEA